MIPRLNAEGMASIFQHLLTIATEQLSVASPRIRG